MTASASAAGLLLLFLNRFAHVGLKNMMVLVFLHFAGNVQSLIVLQLAVAESTTEQPPSLATLNLVEVEASH